MNEKKYWIVFVVDTSGDEPKPGYVLETTIPEKQLKKILDKENKKRAEKNLPLLQYREFEFRPRDPIFYEVERQYMREEGIICNGGFEELVRTIVKAEIKNEKANSK